MGRLKNAIGGSHMEKSRVRNITSGISFPFDYPDKTLKDILLEYYIKKTGRWLLGNEGMLHARYGGSHWEAALSVEFLNSVRRYLDPSDDLYEEIPQVNHETVRWLLSKKEKTNEKLNHWDGVTWDTAVVLRCILLVSKEDNEYFSKKENEEIIDVGINSLTWLFKRFYEWESEVKYPFGEADIAQILITATIAKDKYPEIFSSAEKNIRSLIGEKLNEGDILEDISTFLIKRKTYFKDDKNTCFWVDFFQTAEVTEALTEYYIFLKKSKEKNENLKLFCDAIHKALHAFEIGQVNGMWGAHADTCRALYSYTKCCKSMKIEPENQIVFKALRWVCDGKQTFKDGSFLHTSFITVFYAHALLEVYRSFSLSEKEILEIYDDVVWCLGASSSDERGKRLLAEMENKKLLEDLGDSERANIILKKMLWGGIFTISYIAVGYISIFYYNLINASIQVVSILLAVYMAIIGLICRYEKIFSKRSKEHDQFKTN